MMQYKNAGFLSRTFMTAAVGWHSIFDKSTLVVLVLCPCFTFRVSDSLKPVLIEHQ